MIKKIEIIHCSKSFEKENNKIIAINDLNYKFVSNKFYVIMGESGAGKSTLINVIAGLIKKDSGKILYDGEEILGNKDLARLRNRNIGLVYQSYLLNDNMTALENVMLPLFVNKNINDEESEKRAKESLAELGLEERINHYPKELSGGEQQRVAIARALINNPDIILADEPTGNLDEINEKYIFDLFKELVDKKKKCIIVVSHNEKIKQYADKVLYLKDGVLSENQ